MTILEERSTHGGATSTRSGWSLQLARDDIRRSRVVDSDVPEPQDGQLVLRTSLVAVTANTTAYAELGDRLRYWDFYPTGLDAWGQIPLWGFADVVASRFDGIEPGTRVYGFLPSASHALITPQAVGDARFRDVGGARPGLPAAYNNYLVTSRDPGYVPADREDLQVVYRPLFITSWALADWLSTGDRTDARTLVFSSASSKTASGAALLLREQDATRRLVGLTSSRNHAHVASLGCYDEVLAYDAIDRLPRDVPAAYVDFAGDGALRRAIHAHLSDRLVRDVTVGLTHHQGVDPDAAGLTGVPPVFWFAPDHLRECGKALGPGVLHARFSAAYARTIDTLARWTHIEAGAGPEAFRAAWSAVIDGRGAPGSAQVVSF